MTAIEFSMQNIFNLVDLVNSSQENLNPGIQSARLTESIQGLDGAKFDDLVDQRMSIQNLFFQTLAPLQYHRSAVSFGGTLESLLSRDVVQAYQVEN